MDWCASRQVGVLSVVSTPSRGHTKEQHTPQMDTVPRLPSSSRSLTALTANLSGRFQNVKISPVATPGTQASKPLFPKRSVKKIDFLNMCVVWQGLLAANIPANELETKCRDKLSWNWYVVNGTGLDRSVVLVKSYLLQSNQINHPRNNPGRGRTYDSTCDA
jgi:hypothetical protein